MSHASSTNVLPSIKSLGACAVATIGGGGCMAIQRLGHSVNSTLSSEYVRMKDVLVATRLVVGVLSTTGDGRNMVTLVDR